MSRLLGREVIYFDQRGVGLSLPDTRCPELVNAESAVAQVVSWWRCSRRYRAADIDIYSYNTIENATDIAQLPAVLGVDKIDLIAGSYGTRLASEVLQQFPQSVRCAVLGGMQIAGPNPGDNALDRQAMYNRAAVEFQKRCASNPTCRKLIPEPDLRSVIIKLQRLIARDGQVVIAGIPVDSLDALRERLFVMSYLGQLRNMFFTAMVFAAREDAAGFYRHVGEGDAQAGEIFVKQLLKLARDNVFNSVNGMSVVTRCYDGDDCAAVRLGKSDYSVDEFQVAAGSDHPVLIVSGDLDPATPIQAARAALPLFPQAQYVVYSCLGHDVSRLSNLANGDCLVRQVRGFLNNPSQPILACEEETCASLPLTPTRRQLQALVEEYVVDFQGAP
jgi:pimeloyl-ACP methyl ester carboxylesterase